MRQKYLEALISFCIGVSWVLSLFFGAYLFLHGLSVGFFTALLLFVFGFSVGLFLVAFFEGVMLLGDMAAEKKEQTKILRDILSKLGDERGLLDDKISNN